MSKAAALPCAFLAALLVAAGCGGGCGQPPKSSGPDVGVAEQGPGGGQSSSGGAAPTVSRFDSPSMGASGESAADEAKDAASAPATPRHELRRVAVQDLSKALRAEKGASVVIETASGCADCGVALPVMAQKAREFGDRYDFMSVDLTAAVDSTRSLPILIMYQGARQTSRQVGMPFPRDKQPELEDDASYQRRFSAWLRDALTQGNLKFAGH